MKRLISVFLILVLLASLTACEGITINVDLGGTDPTTVPSETPEGTIPTDSIPATRPEETTPAILPTESIPAGTEEVTLPPVKDPTTPVTLPVQPALTLDTLWDKIGGCWIGDEGRFVYITYNDQGPAFWSGFWENPQPYRRDPAAVSGLNNLGGGLYTMSLTYPPVSGDAADSQDLNPLRYTLALDISGLEAGILRVEAPEDQWRSYTFGGYSYDDAYDASHNVQYANFAQMQEFWQWLTGYWNADDGHFICFDQKDSNSLVFMQGIWDSGAGAGASLKRLCRDIWTCPWRWLSTIPL